MTLIISILAIVLGILLLVALYWLVRDELLEEFPDV
jgi:hypothetical protein